MVITSEDINFLKYRPNVGIVVLNANSEIFVAQRIDAPGPSWQMPQGGIDPGEDPLVAAKRELKEETNIHQIDFIAEYPRQGQWLYYDLPLDLQNKLWGGDYIGQRQKWFIFRFTGKDETIDLHTEHPEFSDWKWTHISDLPNLAVEFKRDLYTHISEFVKTVSGT